MQNKDQAAQLAGLELVNGRELGPITLVCKPRLRRYGPGDMLTVVLPEHGLDGVDCVIINRTVDPGRMTVSLTLVSETPGKYAFALGQTGTAPPAPALLSPEEKDGVSSSVAGNDLDPVSNLTVTPSTAQVVISWRNPTSDDFSYVKIFRGTTNVFGSATQLNGSISGGLGQVQQYTNTSISAGTYYFWVQSFSDDDVPGDAVASGAIAVP